MKKKTIIDAVKVVRKIREKQGRKYYGNTKKLLNDLKKLDDQKQETSHSNA